jgi:predicted DNA-binding antitoxin AbrB/MazE fold protein
MKMGKTIKARFSKGMIEPLEKVKIREGEVITISILEATSNIEKRNFSEALKKTAGGWEGLIDCDELIRNIYNDRLIATRPEVKL